MWVGPDLDAREGAARIRSLLKSAPVSLYFHVEAPIELLHDRLRCWKPNNGLPVKTREFGKSIARPNVSGRVTQTTTGFRPNPAHADVQGRAERNTGAITDTDDVKAGGRAGEFSTRPA
ncbi:hypothetical protein E9232_004853 [Inquilinus ginsengisoli]|uniref:Uncharacterized protein n=1 Tax=Inquilinus ginsengisoli TaxID=363840 RepID=A0ABU1JVI4_9PROT|nr:hypothetical protein [Inquilinus ginsengisoli]MDR6292313.1 hypothetical protein [Inquilinus ginsengisoli]